jgi:hypothetical protein
MGNSHAPKDEKVLVGRNVIHVEILIVGVFWMWALSAFMLAMVSAKGQGVIASRTAFEGKEWGQTFLGPQSLSARFHQGILSEERSKD